MPRLTENPAPQTTSRPGVLLTFDGDLDWLTAVEFGRVSDGQPAEAWVPVEGLEDHVRYLRDSAVDRTFGFAAIDCAELDLHACECEALWRGPRFDVPQLGVTDAPAGAVMAAARQRFRGHNSFNRALFLGAIDQDDDHEAARMWQALLDTGDPLAHYGLGYTLYALGQYRRAYAHLRFYTEIAPESAWVWCWYGKAADAVGEPAEARAAYERALSLEDDDPDPETEAAELLDALDEG